MIKVFETNYDYNIYTLNNTSLLSDILYYVKEDNTGHFYTNNIDGESKIYDLGGGDGDSLSEYIANFSNSYTSTKILESYDIPKTKVKYIIVDGNKLSSSEIDTLYTNYGNINLEVGEHIIRYRFKDASSISDYVLFRGCQDMTKIVIPVTEDYIYYNNFANCYNLEEIEILSNTINEIGNYAFLNCRKLKTIILPSGLTQINQGTFEGAGLEEIILHEGITKIGQTAFYGNKLTSIILPSTITQIDGGCFKYCNKLTSITINATTPPTLNKSKYTDDQGDYYMNDAFDGTNNCPIYVPAASVSAYKAATNWSTYKSRIQAIP
jgi:hypothetical protein